MLSPWLQQIWRDGWIDFNKNGEKDLFEDPTLSAELRVEDLLSRMTVEEKTCQLAPLHGYQRVLQDDAPKSGWRTSFCWFSRGRRLRARGRVFSRGEKNAAAGRRLQRPW